MSHSPTTADFSRPSGGRWLAIETSGRYGSVAAGEADQDRIGVATASDMPRDRRSAQTLAPEVKRLLGGLGWASGELSAVVVAVGPGSFTGLRVGVATAKALAYAADAGIVGVNTLDALAAAVEGPPGPERRLWAVLDAQRGELFASVRTADAVPDETPTERLTRDAFYARLRPGDRVVGPVADALAAQGPAGVAWDAREPSAESVLQVAHRRWLAGGVDNLFQLVPAYHRVSAAEENYKK